MRLKFITDEQIEKWSEELDNDNLTPSLFKEAVLLREICYASSWLSEELKKLNCPDHHIVQFRYTHGFESFTNDCWEVAQDLLIAFKEGNFSFEDEDERSLSGKERSN